MNTKEVKSIAEFLEIVKILSEGGIKLWYRGVADEGFSLLPALYWNDESSFESTYIHHFLVGYKAYTSAEHLRPWDIYSMMQHHGLRTRLLDWTKTPLYALFFALTQDAEKKSKPAVFIMQPHFYNKEVSGIDSVYCPAVLESRVVEMKDGEYLNLDSYLPEALDPDDNRNLPDRPLAIEAPLSLDRLKAQNACFTIHGKSEKSLDSFLEEGSRSISKIVFELNGNKRLLLEELNAYGINEEIIFQDLDHLAMRINREQLEVKKRSS